jgi:hypothetical protein
MTAFSMEGYLAINTGNRKSINNLGTYDILCGRCKTAFNHIGNRRFRVTISMNVPRYLDTKSRHEKSALIISIVRTLREEVGARFLKKKGKSFVELDEKQAREKVGHALRDLAVQQQQSTMTEWTKQLQQEEEKHEKENSRTDEEGNDDQIFHQSLGRLFTMCEDEEDESSSLLLEPLPVRFNASTA